MSPYGVPTQKKITSSLPCKPQISHDVYCLAFYKCGALYIELFLVPNPTHQDPWDVSNHPSIHHTTKTQFHYPTFHCLSVIIPPLFKLITTFLDMHDLVLDQCITKLYYSSNNLLFISP
jgi:hypothetical protein